MEKYFEDENSLTESEILSALRQAAISGKVVPMMCGSALKIKEFSNVRYGYGNTSISIRY